MAEVDDLIDDVEFQRSVPVSCRPEDIDFPVVLPASDFHKIEIKGRETGQWKKKDSKGQISPQQKKELYTKLDDILFTALRQEFEVCPGNTIDRLEMVQFLTSVVHQHLSDCPDLQKVLDLRDTVLTGRVKKVFPEVEYKRKQIKQDHYRKAWISWLYVNIRRKHNSMSTCNLSSASITMKTSTWTQPTDPTALMSNFSSSPSSPANEAHSPSSYINTNTYEYGCSAAPLVLDEPGVTQNQGSPPSGNGSDGMASYVCAQFSSDNLPSERTALMLDNLTLQKWVVSHYAADNLSYVPVQDVVRAFKKDFNVDISYKECHQMILSAFTSPRNRLIPRKTVRVSSIGQQYVYRGIAPLNKATRSSEEAQEAEEFEFVQPADQSEKNEEEGEAWERKIRDITVERDQALMERNQALTALMELEKEHAEAMRTIERLKTETLSNRFVESVSKKPKDLSTKGDELSVNHCDSASLGNLLLKFGNATRNKLRYTGRDGKHDGNTDRHPTNECNHEQYDEYSFLKEVVTQAKEERDYLLKRLEIVKGERNSYLERLHSLEKENQRLRDAVSVRNSDIFQNGLLDDISRHFQTSYHEESNAKEALSSVLSHLKSKRKQVTPSRLNKSPKYDHTTLNEQSTAQVGFDGQSNHLGECSSPASTVDNGVPSPGKLVLPNAGLRLNEKERLFNGDVEKISGNSQGNLGGEGGQSKDDLLVFTSGSGMVGFTPHPLDD